MAKIWFVREGTSPTKGFEGGNRAAEWCIRKLRLKPTDWIAPHNDLLIVIEEPKSTASNSQRYVVIELDDKDLDGLSGGWKDGYYLLSMFADDAKKKLAEPF
jgi:hypothetical protein